MSPPVIRCFRELCDACLVKPIELNKLLGYRNEKRDSRIFQEEMPLHCLC